MAERLIHIFRHGKAAYNQETAVLETASDLLPEGRARVNYNGMKLAEMSADARIKRTTMIVSPAPRCLETARIVRDNLQDHGLQVNKIFTTNRIEDARGFSWEVFNQVVDNKATNPKHLSVQEYTMEDFNKLPAEALSTLSPAVVGLMRLMESSGQAEKRLWKLMAEMAKRWRLKEGEQLVMVTHDALTRGLVKQVTGGEQAQLNPGDAVSLRLDKEGVQTYLNFSPQLAIKGDCESLLATQVKD